MLATVGVTTALLAFVFWRVPVAEVRNAVLRAEGEGLAMAASLALVLNIFVSAYAFQQSNQAVGVALHFSRALRATVANLTLHNLLPAGSGNFGRAAIVHRHFGVALAPALLAVVLLLWLKLASLLLLTVLGSSLTPIEPSVRLAVIVLALGWLLLGGFARMLLPAIARRSSSRKLTHATDALNALPAGTARRAIPAAFGTLILIAGEVAVFYVVLRALGHDTSLGLVLLRVPLVLLAAKVPLTALGLGSREVASVALLGSLLSAHDAVAASLLMMAVSQLLPAAVGAAFAHWLMRTPTRTAG